MAIDFPLAYRKAIEKNIDRTKHRYLEFTQSSEKGIIARYAVKDTPFAFSITKIEKGSDGLMKCELVYKPISSENYAVSSPQIKAKDIGEVFLQWLNTVDEIVNYKSPFDDEYFYQAFDEETYRENNFSDSPEDKTYDKPLNLKSLMQVGELLEQMKKSIDLYLKEHDNSEIKRVREDINVVQENLGGLTKRQIFKIIARYYSVIRKNSYSLFKEVVKTFTINKLLELIDKGSDAMPNLTDLQNLLGL